MASHGTDHLMVQRLLSAGSIRDGQKALVLSGFLVFLQFAIFLFLGATMWVLYDGLPFKPNLVFPWFILTHLPPGFTGFLVAGIFAAAMSTLSSSINSLASATVVDWIKPIKPTVGLIYSAMGICFLGHCFDWWRDAFHIIGKPLGRSWFKYCLSGLWRNSWIFHFTVD